MIRRDDLLKRTFQHYLVPMVVLSIGGSMSEFLDGIVVSALIGNSALAIVNEGMPVMLLSSAVAVLIGTGGSSLYARLTGERKSKDAETVLSKSIAAQVFCGLVLTVVCFALSGQLAHILVGNASISVELESYIRVLALGSLPYLFVLAMNYFLIAAGYPNQATALIIIANAVNILMDFIYILVFDMGVNGAAWATLTGYSVATIATLILLGKHDIRFSKALAFTRKDGHLVQISKIGMSGALGQLGFVAKLFVMNLLANIYAGTSGVIVFSLCFQTISFASWGIAGITSSAMPIASTLFGEHDYAGLRIVMRSATKYLAFAMVALFGLCELFPSILTWLYSISDPELVQMSFHAIRIFTSVHLLRSFVILLMTYYATTAHEGLAMTLSIVDSFGVVPASILLCLGIGLDGIWFSFPLVGAISLLMVFAIPTVLNRRNGGVTKGILMLPSKPNAPVLDVTIELSDADATVLSEEMIAFASKHGCKASQANIIGVLAEEMTEYTVQQAEENTFIDVLTRIEDEHIVMCFRSSGAPLSSLNVAKDAGSSLATTNDQVLHRLASKIEYERILGLNSTLIVLDR